MLSEIKPALNIGPGTFIKEELEARGWRQEDLAEIVELSSKHINELIKNKKPITIETARLLSSAFGQSPQYWINLDTNYRLRMKEDSQKLKGIEIKSLIYRYMPVKEMFKKGWLKKQASIEALEQEIKKYWDKNKLDFSFLEIEPQPRFRKSEAFPQYNHYYALTWYRMARNCAQKHKVNKYRQEALKALSNRLHHFTMQAQGIETFLHELNNGGVKFLVLSHLQKTYIDGASFYDGANPVIVYTRRYDRCDNFWFTVAHEIAHILLHLKNKDDYFLDNLEMLETDKEKEANQLASQMIKSEAVLKWFKPFRQYVSAPRVLMCAQELQIHPSVIVGILQHHKFLDRRNLNKFKTSISDRIPHNYFAEKL
jgi:HTH-type transcriptional regulator / antitoxin HigA